MKAPNKLYIHPNNKGEVGANWLKFPITNEDECYIRKDALLKYLRNEFNIVDFHLKAQDDPVWWGQRNAFQQVIDKIESLSREE